MNEAEFSARFEKSKYTVAILPVTSHEDVPKNSNKALQ